MNICLVSNQQQSNVSGVGTYAQNLISALKIAGHSVDIICAKNSNLHFHPSWILRSLSFAAQIKTHLSTKRVDLIHFLDAREALFTKVSDIPVIGTMNDDYFANSPKNPISFANDYYDWPLRWSYYQVVQALEKLAVTKLTHIIACSDSVKNSVQTAYQIPSERITRIYYGIEATTASLAKPSDKMSNPKICFIGNNAQRKGLGNLVAAFTKLSKNNPLLKLVVIGHNPSMNYFRNQIKNKAPDIINRVKFLGQLSHAETKKILSESIIYAMPSLTEGFGLTFLEAMQLGVPVIGGNVGGAKELIQDHENGFLVSPRNTDQLIAKLLILLNDTNVYEKFRRNGFVTAEQYSLDRMTKETTEVYQKLL